MNPAQDRLSCPGKIRFPSWRLVMMALRRTRATTDWRAKDRNALHPYRCQHCKGWHLGSGEIETGPGPRVPYSRKASRRRGDDHEEDAA